MHSPKLEIQIPSRQAFLDDLISQFVARRKSLRLSQDDVDYIMGNSDRMCSKWECGLRSPTAFNLFCWAEVLNAKVLLIFD